MSTFILRMLYDVNLNSFDCMKLTRNVHTYLGPVIIWNDRADRKIHFPFIFFAEIPHGKT